MRRSVSTAIAVLVVFALVLFAGPTQAETPHSLHYFEYTGGFTLDPATGIFTADALFIVVGGTDRFADAEGIVWVDVEVPFALPELPHPGVSPDIPFVYDLNAFLDLRASSATAVGCPR